MQLYPFLHSQVHPTFPQRIKTFLDKNVNQHTIVPAHLLHVVIVTVERDHVQLIVDIDLVHPDDIDAIGLLLETETVHLSVVDIDLAHLAQSPPATRNRLEESDRLHPKWSTVAR